jgi:hypothetical protein
MFKAIISSVMALAISLSVGVEEVDRIVQQPAGIIGTEYVEIIKDLDERWDNDEIEIEYMIEMTQVEGYWVVHMWGYCDRTEDQEAFGMYDHMPSEEEINELWENRVPEDTLYDLMKEYCF